MLDYYVLFLRRAANDLLVAKQNSRRSNLRYAESNGLLRGAKERLAIRPGSMKTLASPMARLAHLEKEQRVEDRPNKTKEVIGEQGS